ncbi:MULTISPECIES: DUF4330 domain-containing protein [Halorussus]|uniref:DUF4330 domain-containing protein n=1 Tax=Halorussus TaxID=1070314 RepID=UPI000E211254|nr:MULTISPECIES: DUF4330 domain-containing protein [Halorussus]NHN60132.1 DUF4330 domain-containing protein [Halorussus sp. JP-T4]
MNLIDDKGRLFGTVNIIDALAVLLVLAVAGAGTAFVLGADETEPAATQHQTTVTLQITDVQPYVADAIPEGSIDTDRVADVTNKSVRPTKVVVSDQNGTLHVRDHPRKRTVTLAVALNTTVANGEPTFDGEALEVGRQLTLDFGPVTATGNVTEVADSN